jgi:hypothetical protein
MAPGLSLTRLPKAEGLGELERDGAHMITAGVPEPNPH